MIDLASAALGGRVVFATDELFADRRHLIDPRPSAWSPDTYGPDGKIYDGWETRRSRDRDGLPDTDHAIVRLGAAGVIQRVVVDTAHFTGNYPESASIEAVCADGYPTVRELDAMPWTTLVARSKLNGDRANEFAVDDPHRWTHVRLTIHPDGGVARLRVLGEVVPDPRFMSGTVDLVAALNGGRVVDASNRFYSAPENLVLPGTATSIDGGWETARRRGEGNDWVVFALAAAAEPRIAVVDTSGFTGNSPGSAALAARDGQALLPRTRLLPDTEHRFLVSAAAPVSRVRLDIFPDGGLNRVRLLGEVTADGMTALRDRWDATTPG